MLATMSHDFIVVISGCIKHVIYVSSVNRYGMSGGFIAARANCLRPASFTCVQFSVHGIVRII